MTACNDRCKCQVWLSTNTQLIQSYSNIDLDRAKSEALVNIYSLHETKHRQILKISPGAYIFQRPFLRSLFLEGLIYGGKFAFQNRFSQPFSWKEIYCFCSVLLCILGQFPSTSPWRGLSLERPFNRGFFGLGVWGAYIWRGLYIIQKQCTAKQ